MLQQIEYIEINKLHLWSENPRDPINKEASDFEIISHALQDDHEKWNLDKLLNKMGSHYDFSELPTVVKDKDDYIVYDGNRRLALIKILQNQTLYQSIMGKLFLPSNIEHFLNLDKIPCNVCDKETALDNIERKHVETGSWKALERDYFLYRHRGKEKSDFLIINDSTHIIENNKCMNQDFVKNEVLKKDNLHKLGFAIKNNQLVSIYNPNEAKEVLDSVVSVVNKEHISTRKNRGNPIEAIKELQTGIENRINIYSETDNKGPVKNVTYGTPEADKTKVYRKTRRAKKAETLFGETLSLVPGKTNDLYLAIDEIYKSIKEDIIYPIIGMSLRLLLEFAAREQFEKENNRKIISSDKNVYGNFVNKAKKEMSQECLNLSVITQNWLNTNENIEGLLAKYAHGEIAYDKDNILHLSYCVADILKYYFSKK